MSESQQQLRAENFMKIAQEVVNGIIKTLSRISKTFAEPWRVASSKLVSARRTEKNKRIKEDGKHFNFV